MNRWKEKFQQFMIGRYGADQFSRFLSGLILVLLIANLFFRTQILYLLALGLLFYTYFRMFSKNISARFKENQAYLGYEFKVKEFFKKWKFKAGQAKDYHIYKCPKCGQKIRIPRGKGRISIHCPKCGEDFIKNS